MTESDPGSKASRPSAADAAPRAVERAAAASGVGPARPIDPVDIPFWQRLSTRLTLLILVVVAVLAFATTVLVVRGLSTAERGAIELVQEFLQQPSGDLDAGVAEAAERAVDMSGIVRGTLINLVAIFLLTLVGAAVFSRTLLTEPIEQLTRATRDIASGRRVRLPVTSPSELGVLATSFNDMADAVAEARETLEQRVEERTAELQALLEMSNTIAVTLELGPLLEQILERLERGVGFDRAVVYEAELGDGSPDRPARLRPLMQRAAEGLWGREELGREAAHAALRERREVLRRSDEAGGADGAAGSDLALPLIARNRLVGILLVQHRDPAYFSDERRRLATAFAAQVAIAMENVRLYESATEKAAYDERQHLARELHDSVSQALYAILLGTHTAQKQLERAPDKAAGALTYVENLAQAGIAEMRALIFELRPESLEQEGLVGVLRKQVDALETRHGLEAEARLCDEPDLPFASKQVLLRVAQEAMHNIVKHARASTVRVHLRRTRSNGSARLELVVRDDGVGFDPGGDFPGHLGLTSMRERLGALGGDLDIDSTPGEGTTVTARLALAEHDGARDVGDVPTAPDDAPASPRGEAPSAVPPEVESA